MKTETIYLSISGIAGIILLIIITHQYINYRKQYLSLVKRTVYFALYETLLDAIEKKQLLVSFSKANFFKELALKECSKIPLSPKERFNLLIRQGVSNTIRLNIERQIKLSSEIIICYQFKNFEHLYRKVIDKTDYIQETYFYELDFINENKLYETSKQKQLELYSIQN